MVGINPFRPNFPISPGMFVGRIDELKRLESYLIQTCAGKPVNFMITGERGIGKSSLLLYITFLAQNNLVKDGRTLNLLVVDLALDKSLTQKGLIKRVGLILQKKLEKSEAARKFFADVWKFVTRIEAVGIKISADNKPETPETLLEEFYSSLENTIKRICDNSEEGGMFDSVYDGVLLLIDEADHASKELELGSFLKLLMESLQRNGVNKFMVGLAGLDELRNILIESHESSIRLFDHIYLDRLSGEDINRAIDLALAEATKINAKNYKITDDARRALVDLSEGYPHFIQQYGFSAFEADADYTIGEADVLKGAFGEHGALESIGIRYYRNDFYNKVQQESYRQVLRIMADELDGWITKTKIKNRFKGKGSTLDNALKALRERGIIISKEGQKGTYRLQHKGFAVWIKHHTSGLEETKSAE